MADFFNEIKLIKVLKKDELNALLVLAQKGDIEARNKVIKHNLRLLLYQVNKVFFNTPYDKDDLFQIGTIGLMRAVDTFDPEKNINFSTYASRCINNEILMFLRKGKKFLKEVSFDEPIGTGKAGKELVLEDVIADDGKELDEDILLKESIFEIRKQVEQLPGFEKEIIKLYCGFYDNKCYTQAEIADLFGFSKPHISRIISKILNYLKVAFTEEQQDINTEHMTKSKKRRRGNGAEAMSKILKTIYEYFERYDKELINKVIVSLTEEEKYLLTLRYGEDLNNPNTSTLWNNEYYDKFYGEVIPKIRRRLEALSKKVENIQSFTNAKYIRILSILKTPSFNQLVEQLSFKEAIIISLRLGYVDGKCFSTESIANFLGMEEMKVIEITKEVLLLYKKSINDFLDKTINILINNPEELTLKLELKTQD